LQGNSNMKFNEFKNPQLTEEQIVLSYCKGEITKEDAVSHLSEMKVNLDEESWRDKFNKLSWGLSDSDAEIAAQKKAEAEFVGKGLTGHRLRSAKRRAGQAAKKAAPGASFSSNLKAITGLDIGANKAQAATPKLKNPVTKDPKPTIGDFMGDAPNSGVDNFRNMPKPAAKKVSVDNFAAMPKPAAKKVSVDNFAAMPKPAAKTQVPSASAPAARAKVKATAANTRDYDKNMALQKKLIAQGANIKADGLMGPNTRAAMKAAGMGAKKPVAKKKLSGPDALSKLADIPAVSRALGARGELSKDDGEFADPNAMTRRKPKVAKPWVNPDGPGKTQMPRAFGLKSMPRIDSPKGGDKAAFGGKTLSKKDYAAAFGGDN
jgi:hypothetical protein